MRVYRGRAFRRGASGHDYRSEILDGNGGEVESRIESLSFYIGKIGVDNFLLILQCVMCGEPLDTTWEDSGAFDAFEVT